MKIVWTGSFLGTGGYYYFVELIEVERDEFRVVIRAVKESTGSMEMTFAAQEIDVLLQLLTEANYKILPTHKIPPTMVLPIPIIKTSVADIDILLKMSESAIDIDYPESNRSAEVIIYVADSEVGHLEMEKITNSCGDFMEALGYELKSEDEPVYGSFWKRIQFVLNKQVSANELDRAITKGKKALELKHVELPTAEQTEKLANAAKSIIESLEGCNEAVVRLGALLVLKRTINGEPKLIVQQLSSELISILDGKPQLLKSPQTIYELITGDVQGEDDADDSTTRIDTAALPED